MHLHVVPGDESPIYRQIERQIIEAIAGGHLRPGEQLPSHRDLAATLVIAPLTVKKAYDELERGGYIHTARGQGTFVSEAPPALSRAAKLDRLRALARRLLSEAHLVGVEESQLVKLIDEEAARLRTSRARQERMGRERP
jgi:GntR family transcriptional regulator